MRRLLSRVLTLIQVFVRVMPEGNRCGSSEPLVVPHWLAFMEAFKHGGYLPAQIHQIYVPLLWLMIIFNCWLYLLSPTTPLPPANGEHVNVWHNTACSMLIHLWPSWLKMNIGGMVNTGMPQAASQMSASAQDHVNGYTQNKILQILGQMKKKN